MAQARGSEGSGLQTLTDERERGLLRLDELRERVESGDDRAAVAEEALRELHATYEELQVSEEELRAQSRELAEAYRRLVHERQRYRELFEDAPVGYLVTDGDAVVRDANKALASLLGRSPQYLRGKPLRVFVPEGERVEFSRLVRDIREDDGTSAIELRLGGGDTDAFDARCTVTTVRRPDGSIEALRWVIDPVGDGERAEVVARRTLRPVPAVQEDATELSVRIVVLDPQPMFVRTLDVLFETMLPGRARIVAATDDPRELVELVERTEPRLVVAAVPELDSAAEEAVTVVRDRHPGCPVLVLAGSPNEPETGLVRALTERGFPGVVARGAAPDTIVGAVLATAAGWRVLDGAAADGIMEPGRPLPDGLRVLSEQELQLWVGLASGRADADMAEERNVSVRTMKRRVAELYERLGVAGRVEAAALAGHHGLVSAADLTVGGR